MSKFKKIAIDTSEIKYFNVKGIWNAYVEVKGKKYRVRTEVLILNENNDVYMEEIPETNKYGNKYNLPGGSLEPGKSVEEQAVQEAAEEARIVVKDCTYSGLKYIIKYKKFPEWHVEKLHPYGLIYYGTITYITVGKYDKRYTGYIGIHDRQPEMIKNGKFVSIDKLGKLHKQAVEKYIKEV